MILHRIKYVKYIPLEKGLFRLKSTHKTADYQNRGILPILTPKTALLGVLFELRI